MSTARDRVLQQREAFIKDRHREAAAAAKIAFPMPKVQRPRVLIHADKHIGAAIVDGRRKYQYHYEAGMALPKHDYADKLADATIEGDRPHGLFDDAEWFIKTFKTLQCNPTEWVDDE